MTGQKIDVVRNVLPTVCFVKFCLVFVISKNYLCKVRCKADCVAAECTDPGSVAEVTRLSFFFKVSWKMKESENQTLHR